MANLIEKATEQQWTSKRINKVLYLQSRPVTSLSLSQARHRARQQTEHRAHRVRKGIDRAVSDNSAGNLCQSDCRSWMDRSLSPTPFHYSNRVITCGSGRGPSLRFNVRCFWNGGCLVRTMRQAVVLSRGRRTWFPEWLVLLLRQSESLRAAGKASQQQQLCVLHQYPLSFMVLSDF